MKQKNKKNKKGFTLLEMLVVVLIIGILAGIALPQYQMAVTKSKVASILPIMRRWKDALTEYKLRHGYYCEDGEDSPNGSDLGVNWPSDWKYTWDESKSCGDNYICSNDYWSQCFANEEHGGEVFCEHYVNNSDSFRIYMHQSDDPNYENLRGKMTCEADGTEAHKVCKALGGKLANGETRKYILY